MGWGAFTWLARLFVRFISLRDVTFAMRAIASSGTFNTKSLKSITHVVDLDAQSRNNCYQFCTCNVYFWCIIKLFVAALTKESVSVWERDILIDYGPPRRALLQFLDCVQPLKPSSISENSALIWKIAIQLIFTSEHHKSNGRIECALFFFCWFSSK